MQPIRLAIALLLLGGLVLLTVQNLSPTLPLVILGGSTLSLPLAAWIGGAIAAGAATTLVLSALSSLARPVRRSAPKRPAASAGIPFQAPWTPQPSGKAAPTGSAQTKSNSRKDDWDAPPAKDEWDDWEEPAPSAAPSGAPSGTPSAAQYRAPQPEVRDRLDEDWADWDGYDDYQRGSQRNEPQRNEPQRNEPQTSYIPRRIDFETKQEPVTRIQSGSVYSHSYTRTDDPDDRTDDLRDRNDTPPRKPGDVYDAEYRVLTPPYHPNPEPPVEKVPESVNPFHLDDWDFEEDSLDSMEPDEPTERHDRRPIL